MAQFVTSLLVILMAPPMMRPIDAGLKVRLSAGDEAPACPRRGKVDSN